jgi:ATP-binding cassette subfamily B multidrug efflux pump
MSRGKTDAAPRPDEIRYYFRREAGPLAAVTVSGIIYNVGLTAGPYFEGLLAQRLFDIIRGCRPASSMVSLALSYLCVIMLVQVMRAVKRFGVRRFANDTSRSMRRVLYHRLVNMSRAELQEQSLGAVMTKAVSDVDACAEGMRKFTTEVFDTGVVLVAYTAMLFYYDARLALMACLFTPFAYLAAGRLKGRVTRSSAEYKASAGRLSGSTMDRITNALAYRVYGCEQNRDDAYEERLSEYEKRAVAANIWENTMPPLYNIISTGGAVLIIYFGARNVLGTGFTSWNIAAFTTFFSCFTKMALKSSHAAKLFNSVQKAKVSWGRIKPLLGGEPEEELTGESGTAVGAEIIASGVSIGFADGGDILHDISFSAFPGQIIGITGPVACGKTALGRVFIGEVPYSGSITVGGRELREMDSRERSELISYMGHEPELLSDTISENIRLGRSGDVEPVLKAVCLDREVGSMPDGLDTMAGSGGTRLSGGQQARAALARTLYNSRGVLILDDPFSAVDRATEQEIIENLRRSYSDRTVLIISHRLYRFPDFDGILFLSDGGGIFSTHDGLMRGSAQYAELYRRQTEGGEENEA